MVQKLHVQKHTAKVHVQKHRRPRWKAGVLKYQPDYDSDEMAELGSEDWFDEMGERISPPRGKASTEVQKEGDSSSEGF